MRSAAFTAAPRDHPRSRGVYITQNLTLPQVVGSSPLARGLPRRRNRTPGPVGIIPARAGFTPYASPPSCALGDHPRSRGVYAQWQDAMDEGGGSSPLARGLRPGRGIEPRCVRIIPARAGFTHPHSSESGSDWDHPRSRGVYRASRARPACSAGSSPLARGLPHAIEIDADGRRIIPARAGFTGAHPRAARDHRDHPRSRGVYSGNDDLVRHGVGSSPLARGLLEALLTGPSVGGIIPARAGFTFADRWYPNEPVVYQTPAAFTADPGPAPPGRRSVAVVRGGASPLLDVLDATRPPRVSSPGSDTTPTCAGEWRRRPARSGSRRSGGSAPPRTRG